MTPLLSMSRNLAAGAVLMVSIQSAQALDPQIKVDSEVRYEHNIGNSDGPDVLNDFVSSSGVGVTKSLMFDERSGLSLSSDLRYDAYATYFDLSHMTAKAAADYRIQPVPGFTRPWLDLSASTELLQYNNSVIRDGLASGLATSVGKYITDKIQMGIGAGPDVRQAEVGRVYDLSQSRVFATARYALYQDAMLSFNAARVFGDIVTTAAVSGDYAGSAKAYGADPALSTAIKRDAYRVGAQTNQLGATVNYPIGETGSLEVGAAYAHSHTVLGDFYESYMLHIGCVFRLD